MQARIILFDIDGTLVDCGGSGRVSMRLAFERLTGSAEALASIKFGGMTDRAIVRHGLRGARRDDCEQAIDELLALYLSILPEILNQSERYRVLHGAQSAVRTALSGGAAVGLGTGNIRAGAQLKLARGGLEQLFPFGGFGCDAEERSELLRRGAERGAAQLGAPLADCEVLIVGDTPKDIAAAHAIGARCLAVSTGGHSSDELGQAGADWITDSLESPLTKQLLLG